MLSETLSYEKPAIPTFNWEKAATNSLLAW
jgi:hypothetical protein